MNETDKQDDRPADKRTTRRRNVARERWVLVRQGQGPTRKWVWQIAGTAEVETGAEASRP